MARFYQDKILTRLQKILRDPARSWGILQVLANMLDMGSCCFALEFLRINATCNGNLQGREFDRDFFRDQNNIQKEFLQGVDAVNGNSLGDLIWGRNSSGV